MSETSHDDINRAPALGDVSVQLSYPYNNHTGRYARLAVTDRVSGLTLVEVDLNAQQLMDFMAHSSVLAFDATLPAHPERIGKRHETDSTAIGRNDPRDPEQVRAGYIANGWDTAQVRRTNGGHQVVAHRWITD